MTASALPSVIIVGSINSDLVVRAPRLPQAGESLVGAGYQRVPGGKGANQAVAVARLGASATFVGRTGADAEGELLRSNLSSAGVRTDFLATSPSASTGLAVITIDGNGRNCIVVICGANEQLTEEDVRTALSSATYDALLLQLEVPAPTIIAACNLAARRDIPVILDAGPAQTFPLEQLQGLHILSPNETETLALTGIDPRNEDAMRAAAEILLRRSNARFVVLKLGDRGALLSWKAADRTLFEYFPPYRIDAVDTTAAGDAFTAAMAVEYVRTQDIRRAVQFGNAAGALAAMSFGAQPSLLTALTLCAFHNSHTPYVI